MRLTTLKFKTDITESEVNGFLSMFSWTPGKKLKAHVCLDRRERVMKIIMDTDVPMPGMWPQVFESVTYADFPSLCNSTNLTRK